MRVRTIQICNITNIIRDWIMHSLVFYSQSWLLFIYVYFNQ